MYAVVQVRGVVNTRREIKDTLKMLRLHHINHCVIAPDTPADRRPQGTVSAADPGCGREGGGGP